jgi:hypothetical protein
MVMTPVDSGQLFLLAGIVIIAYLWLVDWSPRDLLLKANNALRWENSKTRDKQLGGRQVREQLLSIS